MSVIRTTPRRERTRVPAVCQHCQRTYQREIQRREQKYCCHACSARAQSAAKRKWLDPHRRRRERSSEPPPTELEVRPAVPRFLSEGGRIRKAPPQARDSSLPDLLSPVPEGPEPLPPPIRDAIAEARHDRP